MFSTARVCIDAEHMTHQEKPLECTPVEGRAIIPHRRGPCSRWRGSSPFHTTPTVKAGQVVVLLRHHALVLRQSRRPPGKPASLHAPSSVSALDDLSVFSGILRPQAMQLKKRPGASHRRRSTSLSTHCHAVLPDGAVLIQGSSMGDAQLRSTPSVARDQHRALNMPVQSSLKQAAKAAQTADALSVIVDGNVLLHPAPPFIGKPAMKKYSAGGEANFQDKNASVVFILSLFCLWGRSFRCRLLDICSRLATAAVVLFSSRKSRPCKTAVRLLCQLP